MSTILPLSTTSESHPGIAVYAALDDESSMTRLIDGFLAAIWRMSKVALTTQGITAFGSGVNETSEAWDTCKISTPIDYSEQSHSVDYT